MGSDYNFDQFNIVDALFRDNPSILGVQASEKQSIQLEETMSQPAIKLQRPTSKSPAQASITLRQKQDSARRKQQQARKRFGSNTKYQNKGQQQNQNDLISQISQNYPEDFIEQSEVNINYKDNKYPKRKVSFGKSLNISDSIQQSIHITESFVSPQTGSNFITKKNKKGAKQTSGIFQSIASVPQQIHLQSGRQRAGSSTVQAVEESIHLQGSISKLEGQGEVEDEEYSQNFESLHQSQSFIRGSVSNARSQRNKFEPHSININQKFNPIKTGGGSLSSFRKNQQAGNQSNLQKAVQLEKEIQKKLGERENVILAKKLQEYELEIKHQKSVIELKDQQLKRWMQNKEQVSNELNKKHIETLQQVTDSFLQHLRKIQPIQVPPPSSNFLPNRPVRVTASSDLVIKPQKMQSPSKKGQEQQSGMDYSQDFQSLQESKLTIKNRLSTSQNAKKINKIEQEESSQIVQQIEKQDEDQFSQQPSSAAKRHTRRASPFSSPGIQTDDQVSQSIHQSIPQSLPKSQESIAQQIQTANTHYDKQTPRKVSLTGEQIMESIQMKSVKRSTGATSPLLGLRKKSKVHKPQQSISQIKQQNSNKSQNSLSAQLKRRGSGSYQPPLTSLTSTNIDSIIQRLQKSLDKRRGKEVQHLNQLLNDNKITQNEYKQKKRQLEHWIDRQRQNIRDARRSIRSGWDQAQDLIERLASDKQFIVQTLGGGTSSSYEIGRDDSSGGLGDSLRLKEIQQQLNDLMSKNNSPAKQEAKMKLIKDEREIRRKRDAAQRLLESKERAIQQGLRKRLIAVQSEHIDELMNLALKIDVGKEIRQRSEYAIAALKRRDISPESLKQAYQNRNRGIQLINQNRQQQQPPVKITSPGGSTKKFQPATPIQQPDIANQISESIKQQIPFNASQSLKTNKQQQKPPSQVAQSYSQDFQSQSQFYSQSISKVVKPNDQQSQSRLKKQQQSILEEQESGGVNLTEQALNAARGRRESDKKCSTVMSEDLPHSYTAESGVLMKGTNSSQSEDKTANSKDSVEWVLSLQDKQFDREKAEQKKVLDAARNLDEQLLNATDEYSQNFDEFQDEDIDDDDDDDKDLKSIEEEKKLSPKEKKAEDVLNLVIEQLIRYAIPENFSLRRPRLLCSKLQDKLNEIIQSNAAEKLQQEQNFRKGHKMGIKRDAQAVGQFIDEIFAQLRAYNDDAEIAQDINNILTYSENFDSATPRFNRQGSFSSNKYTAGRTSFGQRADSSLSGGVIFTRQYPDRSIFQKLKSKRLYRADLYRNLIPGVSNQLQYDRLVKEKSLGEFIEDQDDRQSLIDSQMFHDDMIFKVVQNAFLQFFNEKAIKANAWNNVAEYRMPVKVSKKIEFKAKDVEKLFKQIKDKVMKNAQFGCGVIQLPQEVLVHAEAVHQKDSGDDIFSRGSLIDQGVNIKEEIQKLREKRIKQLIIQEVQRDEAKWLKYEIDESKVKKEISDHVLDYLAQDTVEWLDNVENNNNSY